WNQMARQYPAIDNDPLASQDSQERFFLKQVFYPHRDVTILGKGPKDRETTALTKARLKA
ncbi:hypothetical protein, partial [Persicirhabdus sediminis]|uniref:hypothetical protein n=1 Tax=Persicirhabdus sediminis TaxID=454144 RepID=UPI001F2B9278